MKLTELDHRRAPRKLLSDAISASLTIGGRKFESTVLDYTLHGVSVRVEKDAMKRAERENFEIELAVEDQDTRYLGQVRHSRLDKNRAVLGIQFTGIQQDDEVVSFLSDDPDWDLVEDPETLSNIFSDLAFKGDETPIAYRCFGAKAALIPRSLKDERFLVTEIKNAERGTVKPGRGSFRFELFQTCHAFEASVVAADSKTVTIELPTKVARLLRRETVRIQTEQSGVFLKIKLKSSFLGDSPEEVEVFDFSEHGIAVLDSTGWIYGPKGARFDSIEVETPSGEKIRGTGVISSYRWIPEKSAYAVGIQFSTASDEDRNRWHNAILHARYPHLFFGYIDDDYNPIWSLFETSGYVGHLDQTTANNQISETRAKSRTTWASLEESGVKNSRRLTHRIDSEIVGHLQMDRYYGETWCVHHLAIHKKVSKVVAKDLYGSVTDILSSENAKYLVSYHRPDLAWNQRNYYAFVEKYPFKAHHDITPFHLYDVDLAAALKASTQGVATVGPANKWDIKRILRYFEISQPKLVNEAISLTEKDPLLEQLNREIVPFQLERGRRFVVASEKGRLVAFAQVEWGSPAVNVFRLFDAIFLHVLEPLAVGTLEQLLVASFSELQSLGRTRALLMLKDGQVPAEPMAGVNYLCDEVRWIANCEATRRYQAYSQAMFGHLILRRGSRSGKTKITE